SQEAEGDLDRTDVDTMFDPVDDYSDQQPAREAHNRKVGKAQETGNNGRCLASDKHGNAEFEREQGAGVIDQAFAFEGIDDPFREFEASSDRGGGNGVRRRHYRAEGKARAPIKTREEPLRRFSYAKHRECNQTER